MRPLAGHPHAVWLTHTHPATVHSMLALPIFCRSSPYTRCASPLAGGSAGATHTPWLGSMARARQLPTLPAASSATVHTGEVGLAPVHVVHAVRRGGSSSLPQALELAANLWVLCRSPVREVNIVGERILKPDSSPPAWNARRTTVGTVVLCMCGVLLVLLVLLVGEGESGIAAGGTASLPGGGGIAAGENVRATDWVCVRVHACLLPGSRW